jgi:hypothetical protein
MSKSELLLAGLLVIAVVGTAWAQSTPRGPGGSTTGVGNYDFGGAGGSLGGTGSASGMGLGGTGQRNGVGASSGGADSSGFGGSFSLQGSGLPAGVSALPPVGATR